MTKGHVALYKNICVGRVFGCPQNIEEVFPKAYQALTKDQRSKIIQGGVFGRPKTTLRRSLIFDLWSTKDYSWEIFDL